MRIINKLPPHYVEHEFFNEMIPHFDMDVFGDKIVYITYDNKNIDVVGKDVVVIQTAGNERAEVPLYHNKVGLVFKHHLDQDCVDNVYHIPLIYAGGFTGNSNIPISDREYDVTFIGRKAARRLPAIEAFERFAASTKRRIFIRFTNKWMGGLPMDQYSELMSQTKIALSPSGMIRCECLRFTEAVKCGCAIIACSHPPLRVFKTCPAVYTDDWDNLETLVDDILTGNKLVEIHDRMKISWDEYFSPLAVAAYINKIVRMRLGIAQCR